MTRHRDIAAFDDRAPGYDEGWQGRLHHEIADRTVTLLTSTGEPPAGVRRHKARTRRRAERLLRAAGFRSPGWHSVYAVLINAVTARR